MGFMVKADSDLVTRHLTAYYFRVLLRSLPIAVGEAGEVILGSLQPAQTR